MSVRASGGRLRRATRGAGAGFGLLCVLALLSAGSSSAEVPTVKVTVTTTQPVVIVPGASAALQFQVSNPSATDPSGDYLLQVGLPSGVTLAPPSDCSFDGDTSTATCEGTSLDVGGTASFNLELTAPSDQAAASDLSIPYQTSSSSADPAFVPDSGSISASIQPSADLSVSLAFDAPSAIAGGQPFTATATVTNAGPSDSGDTSVTIGPLPSGLTITSAGDNCSLSNSADPEATTYDTAKCDVGNLTASGDGASTSQSVDISTDPSVLGVVTIPASTQGTSDDPSTDHNATSAGIEIDAVADLSLSLSLNPATNVIAGGSPFTAHAEVSNLGPSNSHGEDVTFTLPSGDLTFGSLPGSCGSPVGQSVSCSLGDLAQGDPAAVVEIPINAKASALGTYHVLASVASDVSSEPGGDSLLNDNADTTVGVIAQADLDITSVAASPSLICANSGASPVPTAACPDTGTTVQNIESFTVTLVNHGPSDSRTTLLTVAPPPQSGGGVDLLGQYDYCVDPCGGTYTPLPLSRQISLGASGELPPNSPQTIYVRARALSPLRHGIYTNLAQSFSVSTSTSPVPSPVGVTTRSSSPMFSIATVPEPVQGVSAVPGNGLAVVTWHPTPTSSNGGQSVNSYLITLTPPAGSGLSKVTKSILASATPVVCPDTATTTCLQGTVTGLQNDVKVAGVAASYTADVQAVNAVGPSDIDPGTGGSEASVRPSVDAAATSVATNTASSITTCTTATTTHPTCVSYSIPSGAGGVFGAQGNVPLTNFTCPLSTTNTCFAGTGAFSIGALTGYAYTNPLVESVTWDYSTIPTCDKKPKPNPCIATSPVCPNNSTSTSCYPNTIPIFYETSAALKLGLPATYLNSPSAPHFCALKAPLGAGNQGFARKPPTTDSSGTACIKKINILGSKSDPAANGDVQAQFNLDSGSDALAGHH